MSDTQQREAFIAGLRDLADRLERHPDAPLPYHGTYAPILVMAHSLDELFGAARCYQGWWEQDVSGELRFVAGVPGVNLHVVRVDDSEQGAA